MVSFTIFNPANLSKEEIESDEDILKQKLKALKNMVLIMSRLCQNDLVEKI